VKSTTQPAEIISSAVMPTLENPGGGISPETLLRSEPQVKVNCDLQRLARFGANISDAHSCFIFLPAELLTTLTCTPKLNEGADSSTLVLAGYHSLSSSVIVDCRLPRGAGLIGWVAKHNRSIHVSPFELDSRTLGIYSSDQQLKSFVGVPVALDHGRTTACAGVIACDSKKSFAFSKLQIKLLEDLAAEISNTVQLLLLYGWQGQVDVAWQTFLRRAEELALALGNTAVEILRIRLANFEALESSLGTSAALALAEQLFRLLQQALPPHFPLVRLISGDIIICLDNMMTSFYENKIRALCERIGMPDRNPVLEFIKTPSRNRKRKIMSIEALVAETARPGQSTTQRFAKFEEGMEYEHHRA